jgi:hypothetical protein
MDNYERQLHRGILQALGVREPALQLKVETDLGGVVVELRDARGGLDDFRQGKYVEGLRLTDCRENNIAEKAEEAAAKLRPRIKSNVQSR